MVHRMKCRGHRQVLRPPSRHWLHQSSTIMTALKISSALPFLSFHPFHITYWSTKRKRLSSLRVASFTWLPISTGSACTAFEAWPDFVLLREASEEGQLCKLLTRSLPHYPYALSQGYLHVFPAHVWYEVEKRRSYMRSWHNRLNSKARPLWLTPHWVTQYWTWHTAPTNSSAYLLMMSLPSLASREQGNLWMDEIMKVWNERSKSGNRKQGWLVNAILENTQDLVNDEIKR